MRKTLNSGAALWQKAKKLIPGGNQLLSKRAEMFLPDQWPAYYKKAKGVFVWDLDDNKYIDMSIMGMGTCMLGYSDEKVNAAVKKAVDDGSMATLNCPEEVELAEKLIGLHPWAEMVRFGRSGGEATAIAVRIARAFSKKDKIAFCGYHGWNDWYLAANLADGKNLDGQLLPGLEPAGVPRALKESSIPFHYGKIEEFKEIAAKYGDSLGVVIMEVGRNTPDVNFLKEVQAIAKKIGAVLIFDEVSSGFRLRTGGMHILYGLEPDMTILGKAMGNGFPITAVLGKSNVMQAAQDSFISSTFWSERVGFAAALATIGQYEQLNVPKHLSEIGEYLGQGLKKIFLKYKLNITIVGLAPVPTLAIKEKDALLIKTVFTQEMLKRGFLASTVVYVSYAHTKEIVDQYLEQADEVFKAIAWAYQKNELAKMLEGPVCHSGFSRLT